MRIHVPRNLFVAVACLVSASCTQSGYIENPVARSIGWFSYIAGEDILSECQVGVSARYRFVYNAIYTEQVRTYDVSLSADGETATLISRVIQPHPSVRIDLKEPFGPWRGAVERTSMDRRAIRRLRDALRDSGYGDLAPAGLRLRSDNFYWLVSSCDEGRFHLNAFQAPTERFARLEFPAVLFDHDSTGVAVHPVRELTFGASEPTLSVDRSVVKEVGFVMQVGRDGRLR